jgi:hypothetical protein
VLVVQVDVVGLQLRKGARKGLHDVRGVAARRKGLVGPVITQVDRTEFRREEYVGAAACLGEPFA